MKIWVTSGAFQKSSLRARYFLCSKIPAVGKGFYVTHQSCPGTWRIADTNQRPTAFNLSKNPRPEGKVVLVTASPLRRCQVVRVHLVWGVKLLLQELGGRTSCLFVTIFAEKRTNVLDDVFFLVNTMRSINQEINEFYFLDLWFSKFVGLRTTLHLWKLLRTLKWICLCV